jgi:RHS repeat-associated protein
VSLIYNNLPTGSRVHFAVRSGTITCSGGNNAPTVSIASPAANTVFNAPATIAVTANAADSDGTVTKVDFYQGATLIGTATASPYTIQWANVAAGTYSLTAVATDNGNASTTSAAVPVIVNALPTVSITSPAPGATFNAPATVIVTATAADADGTVTKVDFFDGATFVGTATAAPFSIILNNVAAGAHTYTAVATDNRNATATSAAVAISVNAAPTVSITAPAANAVFNALASITVTASAADTDGTVSQVQFFANGNPIGTAISAPFTISWTNVAAGAYSLTAIATDNSGATTTSATVAISVNAAPTVSITAPAANAIFAAPASITVTASAADSDGTVTKVDFYQGAALIGTATASPYAIQWANVAAGAYTLTAIATDSANATTTSAAVVIIVNAPPTVSITAPLSGATYNAPATIILTASAADSDGTVTQVQFFDGASSVGIVTAAPYTVTLANVAAGAHSYTAVATDNRGATATSAAVTISANALPTVSIISPAANAVFAAPATISVTANATDADGTVSQVQFFANGNPIGTAGAAPFTISWANAAAGSYSLTAVATDNTGATTTSTAVAITVNTLPTVSITAPTAGATFNAPANITVTATAADTDGTITKVDFFHGATLIGTATASPYTIQWTGVATGSYSLTAVATDNLGGTTTSKAVAITVNVARVNYFIHPDHLNTPRLIANQSQQTVWKWDQAEPFGNNPADENPSTLGTFDLPLRFPGQRYDSETNLHYNYFRDYDPGVGRYAQSDPIGLRGGLNTYLYARADLLGSSDVLGLDVIIKFFPGFPGHIGIGINTDETVGRYPVLRRPVRLASCGNYAGVIAFDRDLQLPGDYAAAESPLRIRTEPWQDQLMQQYITARQESGAQIYNLCVNMCTSFVEEVLRAGLVAAPELNRVLATPKSLLRGLQRLHRGAGAGE